MMLLTARVAPRLSRHQTQTTMLLELSLCDDEENKQERRSEVPATSMLASWRCFHAEQELVLLEKKVIFPITRARMNSSTLNCLNTNKRLLVLMLKWKWWSEKESNRQASLELIIYPQLHTNTHMTTSTTWSGWVGESNKSFSRLLHARSCSRRQENINQSTKRRRKKKLPKHFLLAHISSTYNASHISNEWCGAGKLFEAFVIIEEIGFVIHVNIIFLSRIPFIHSSTENEDIHQRTNSSTLLEKFSVNIWDSSRS